MVSLIQVDYRDGRFVVTGHIHGREMNKYRFKYCRRRPPLERRRVSMAQRPGLGSRDRGVLGCMAEGRAGIPIPHLARVRSTMGNKSHV